MDKAIRLLLGSICLGTSLSACSLSLYTQPVPLPTPTVLFIRTPTSPSPTASPTAPTPIPVTPNVSTVLPPTFASPTSRPPLPATQAPPLNFCADGQAAVLIDGFKSALQTSDGTSLAALVSPAHGMDARYYRDGRVVNYDREHARFLFDSTFAVDWGTAPGSGLETRGSFHEVILPALLDVFDKNYTLTCNQVQVGGTTYQALWPYPGINFYSVYFPGTQGNGSLDWHTWLIGMEYVNGRPYLYAVMQFQWEP